MPDPVPKPPGRPPGEPIIIKNAFRPPEAPEIEEGPWMKKKRTIQRSRGRQSSLKCRHPLDPGNKRAGTASVIPTTLALG